MFTKEPEPLRRDQAYRYQHDVSDLMRALDTIADRNQRTLPLPVGHFKGIVGKEPYPVSRKTGELLRHLLLKGFEKLKNLFKGNKSRSEVVATFISILEMCKNNTVTLEDDVNGENPTIRLMEKGGKEETPLGTN